MNASSIPSLWRLEKHPSSSSSASLTSHRARLTSEHRHLRRPTHGDQQLTFLRGYYEQYSTNHGSSPAANNDLVAMACLLHGTAHAAIGADDDSSIRWYVCGEVARRGDRTAAAIRESASPRCTTSASDGKCNIPSGCGSIPCSNAGATPCWPQRSSNTNKRASRSGCSQRFGIRPGRGYFRGGSSLRPKRMRRAPIAGRWSPIVPANTRAAAGGLRRVRRSG